MMLPRVFNKKSSSVIWISLKSELQWASFVRGNGLAPTRRQPNIWTGDGLVFSCIYTSFRLNVLTSTTIYLIPHDYNIHFVCGLVTILQWTLVDVHVYLQKTEGNCIICMICKCCNITCAFSPFCLNMSLPVENTPLICNLSKRLVECNSSIQSQLEYICYIATIFQPTFIILYTLNSFEKFDWRSILNFYLMNFYASWNMHPHFSSCSTMPFVNLNKIGIPMTT